MFSLFIWVTGLLLLLGFIFFIIAAIAESFVKPIESEEVKPIKFEEPIMILNRPLKD